MDYVKLWPRWAMQLIQNDPERFEDPDGDGDGDEEGNGTSFPSAEHAAGANWNHH